MTFPPFSTLPVATRLRQFYHIVIFPYIYPYKLFTPKYCPIVFE